MSQRLPALRLIARAVIETPRNNAAAIQTPPARRNAELPCRRFGSIEPPWPHADLKLNYKNRLAGTGDQLSDVAQTSSLWSVARILSADCSKMLRIPPLTASLPSLKIKNLVPFSRTARKARSRP
jgi:hypothetical protein